MISTTVVKIENEKPDQKIIEKLMTNYLYYLGRGRVTSRCWIFHLQLSGDIR